MNENNVYKYFLGSNCACGFKYNFNEFYDKDNYVIIIKGCPGSGKATVMNKFYEKLYREEDHCEKIYCSSDSSSLDGIIFTDRHLAILDGTPPHTMEPFNPLVRDEIFSTYSFLKDIQCVNKQNIILNKEKCSYYHGLSGAHLCRAMELEECKARLIDEAACNRLADKIAASLWEKIYSRNIKDCGIKKIRYLSAITDNGVVTFWDTVKKASDPESIYALRDSNHLISQKIIARVLNFADKNKVNTIISPDPLSKDNIPENLLFPNLKASLITISNYNQPNFVPYHTENLDLHVKNRMIMGNGNIISSIRNAQKEEINLAVNNLKTAKMYHDRLEREYIANMDFKSMDKFTEHYINRFLQPCKG